MSDILGKYLGLPPMGEIEDAEIVEDSPIEKPRSKASSEMAKRMKSNAEIVEQPKGTVISNRSQEAESDHDFARKNMYEVIEKGNLALENLLDVATFSQHAEAYKVLALTMKTLVDANKELVLLSKEKSESASPNNSGAVTNNNLFVGTTNDLLKVLTDMRKNNDSQKDISG